MSSAQPEGELRFDVHFADKEMSPERSGDLSRDLGANKGGGWKAPPSAALPASRVWTFETGKGNFLLTRRVGRESVWTGQRGQGGRGDPHTVSPVCSQQHPPHRLLSPRSVLPLCAMQTKYSSPYFLGFY